MRNGPIIQHRATHVFSRHELVTNAVTYFIKVAHIRQKISAALVYSQFNYEILTDFSTNPQYCDCA